MINHAVLHQVVGDNLSFLKLIQKLITDTEDITDTEIES